MVPKLVVLDVKEMPGGGQVVQGKVEVGGQNAFAFLVQPDLETAFWSLPDGETVRDPERLRGVLNLLLMAVLSGDVEGLAPAEELSPEEFQTAQKTWRLGLQHGWSAAKVGDPQSAANQFAYCWDLIWPAQLHLPSPEVV